MVQRQTRITTLSANLLNHKRLYGFLTKNLSSDVPARLGLKAAAWVLIMCKPSLIHQRRLGSGLTRPEPWLEYSDCVFTITTHQNQWNDLWSEQYPNDMQSWVVAVVTVSSE